MNRLNALQIMKTLRWLNDHAVSSALLVLLFAITAVAHMAARNVANMFATLPGYLSNLGMTASSAVSEPWSSSTSIPGCRYRSPGRPWPVSSDWNSAAPRAGQSRPRWLCCQCPASVTSGSV